MVELGQHVAEATQHHTGEVPSMVPTAEVFQGLGHLAFAAKTGNTSGGGNKNGQQSDADKEAAEQLRRALQTSMDTRQ